MSAVVLGKRVCQNDCAQPASTKRPKQHMNPSQPTNTKRKADAASEQASSGKRAKRSADNAVNTAPPQNNVNHTFTENTASREIKTQPAPTTPSDSKWLVVLFILQMIIRTDKHACSQRKVLWRVHNILTSYYYFYLISGQHSKRGQSG
ncbi:hypothetical protein BX661DRAFT_176777 [Kickxella alabastrina]|uniref:uncharacterized protein n=1 Tax=Kickxella alabastrina TaxID=61397 RepID=UPI00221F8FA0|nr:uncharacterized protein BX661DRAFT_176777 [Kickxella alabastrina]KAI7834195.1 hypothetical protein BX661DRAFT_176777 [Kickxella alabastrina]